MPLETLKRLCRLTRQGRFFVGSPHGGSSTTSAAMDRLFWMIQPGKPLMARIRWLSLSVT